MDEDDLAVVGEAGVGLEPAGTELEGQAEG
jgi:hypothetical protein